MAGKSHGKSRRKTPWDGKTELTPTQEFLRTHYKKHYEARHPKLSTTGEAEMINSFVPVRCPYCGSERFNKRGLTTNGIQRYRCSCGQTFVPTTHTIFDGRKISVSEWMEYCLNLFRYVSINADSWNNYYLCTLYLAVALREGQNRIWLSEKCKHSAY